MAFDGVVIANIVYDMNRLLTGGRIYKIYQPEADELLLVVKNNKETYRLLISAGASLPLIYFTTKTKANPMTAPNFCMLLRKYISNGRIIEITQPGMERIVEITIEHLNELGDTCRKKMVIEIMGKHSNIIFIDEKNMIIDSIKHISNQVSSVREVLPGRTYIAPPGKGKISLNDLSVEWMENTLLVKPVSVQKAVYGSISGISPDVFHMDSSEQMKRRPMDPLLSSLAELGCEVRCEGEDGHFPFTLGCSYSQNTRFFSKYYLRRKSPKRIRCVYIFHVQ